MKKFFEGSFEELQALLREMDPAGTWENLEHGKQFVASEGAIVNWWQNGTVNVQGPQPARKKMEKKLAAHLADRKSAAKATAKDPHRTTKELKETADLMRLLYADLKQTGDLYPIPESLEALLEQHINRIAKGKRIHAFIYWVDIMFQTNWRNFPQSREHLCSLPILYVMSILSKQLYNDEVDANPLYVAQMLMDQYPRKQRLADYVKRGNRWSIRSTGRCHEEMGLRFSFSIKGQPPEEHAWLEA